MPLTYATKSGVGDFDPAPAGTHIAVCDIVADLGVQKGSALYPAPKPQVYFRFELPNERIDFDKDGKKQNGPRVIGKRYTASMNEKANLRHDLESWRGRAFTDEEASTFDVSKVLGKPCMLTVTHTEKSGRIYANITGIGPLLRGVKPETIIPEISAILYSPDNTATYQQLPEWLRKVIDEQIVPEIKEPQTELVEEATDGRQWDENVTITDDDIPF
jgi:hypothetical protein